MLSSVWHDPPGSRFTRVPWLGRFMDRVERGIEWLHARLRPDPRVGARAEKRASTSRIGSGARSPPRLAYLSRAGRRSRIAGSCCGSRSRFARACRSPLVGTEFVPETDQGFISLRLNTPVGSSLEYTDSKVRQVEAVLKAYPGDRADDDDDRHRRRPQLRARQPEARRPRQAAAARRRSSSRRSARR